MNRIDFFKDKQKIYQRNPVLFSSEVCNFEVDDWQEKVLMDLACFSKVTVRSGQGVGKTGVEAIALLWFLSCFPYPRVVATAPTKQQLHDVLWSEAAKWQSKSPLLSTILKWTKTYIYMIGMEKRWFAVARTATRPENMQGFHEENMLFIIDEASGVADPIMEAIYGTLTGDNNKLLMCGNPTKASGSFYESHTKDRDIFKSHRVSSRDSKRTSKENIEALERKYGKDSNVVRVRVDGEFPLQDDDVFIPLEFVERAIASNVKPAGNILHLGIDVARFGSNETVIAPRIGGKCFELKAYMKQSTTDTVGKILSIARDMYRQYPQVVRSEIFVDDTGVGGGVTDQLKEIIRSKGLPYTVYGINNDSSADDKEHYDNLATEQHAILRDWLQENFSLYIQGKPATIQLPNDEKLISQLTARKYSITSKGKIRLESKKDMEKRGLASPDRADAVVLAFAPIGNKNNPASVLLGGMKIYA